ncbi:MAG: MarR family transcriptional regulator [Austwickia sp.]|nr:MarR family transcriptional regulator [Austwickia sp.]MBK8435090.1 MarR family transcriptional regulator [Austwickia sp.]MBK9101356.1 MarR family transcriptional regulator [Austwickia sp.]
MDVSPDQIITAVRRAVLHLAGEGARFTRAHGINLTDVRALVVLLDLHREGKVATPGRLGAALGLASASTTQVIDRLQQRGLVRRSPDPQDRRRVRLEVTDAAIASGEATFQPLLRHIADLAAARTPTERATIYAFLEELTDLRGDTWSGPAMRRPGAG